MDQQLTARRLIASFQQFRRLHWQASTFAGLKHSELVLLSKIEQHSPPASLGLKMSELSGLLQLATPTVTEVVNGLVDKGLVERNRDPGDRRAVRVRLTEQGAAVSAEGRATLVRLFAGLAGRLGPEQSEQLLRLLATVFDYFDQLSGEMKDNA